MDFEQGKIKFKPRVKLYHKTYVHLVILAFQSINLIASLPWAILHKDYYSFKIFLSFWLAQIPRLIVMQNQNCSKSCKGSIGPERGELSEWVILHSRIYWMTQWLQWQVWQPLKCFFTDGPLQSLTAYPRHSRQVQTPPLRLPPLPQPRMTIYTPTHFFKWVAWFNMQVIVSMWDNQNSSYKIIPSWFYSVAPRVLEIMDS